MSIPEAYDAWHGIYRIVRGHEKAGFGFWKPEDVLSERQIEEAVNWYRGLCGPLASWYRCQGLSEVAQGADGCMQRQELLREALANADQQSGPNRIVTVSAWPLRALLDIGEVEWFDRELGGLLPIIVDEPNPFRRQDGLYALLFVDAPRPSLDRVFSLFCAACADAQKTQTMRRMAVYVDRVDHGKAIEVCLLIRESRRRRGALRAIGEEAAVQ